MVRMYDMNQPATLVYWPGRDGEAETPCPTLRDALQQADVAAESVPWIVTWNGEIINPREIAVLKTDLPRSSPAPKARRRGFLDALRTRSPARPAGYEIGLGE